MLAAELGLRGDTVPGNAAVPAGWCHQHTRHVSGAKRWGGQKVEALPPPRFHTPGLRPRDGDVTVRAASGTGHVQHATGRRSGPSTLPMVG